MAADPDVNILGPFTSINTNVERLRIRKIFYLPAPFVGLFIEKDLTPMEVWTRLCRTIFDGGLEVDCSPIINWLCDALTLKTGDEKSPLFMPRPTVPLADGDLLRHRNHMLSCHLVRLYPTLQRV